MFFVFLFILGLCLVATGHKGLKVLGACLMLFAGVFIALGVLLTTLPLLVLAIFPIAVAYVIYKSWV